MRCLTCSGRGWVLNEATDRALQPALPCPRCAGSGWDHSCEGCDASCEVLTVEPKPAWLDLQLKNIEPHPVR
jgi:DnaJ-class molecular chaperone